MVETMIGWLRGIGIAFVLTLLMTDGASAQGSASPINVDFEHAQSVAAQATPAPAATHAFWDTENIALFGGVTGSRALDFASTKHFRALVLHEALLTDRIVDNTPLFAGIEAAGTVASIGVSYLFHRTGHHTLERWVSYVHIGVTVFGAVRNYSLTPPATLIPAGVRIR